MLEAVQEASPCRSFLGLCPKKRGIPLGVKLSQARGPGNSPPEGQGHEIAGPVLARLRPVENSREAQSDCQSWPGSCCDLHMVGERFSGAGVHCFASLLKFYCASLGLPAVCPSFRWHRWPRCRMIRVSRPCFSDRPSSWPQRPRIGAARREAGHIGNADATSCDLPKS